MDKLQSQRNIRLSDFWVEVSLWIGQFRTSLEFECLYGEAQIKDVAVRSTRRHRADSCAWRSLLDGTSHLLESRRLLSPVGIIDISVFHHLPLLLTIEGRAQDDSNKSLQPQLSLLRADLQEFICTFDCHSSDTCFSLLIFPHCTEKNKTAS